MPSISTADVLELERTARRIRRRIVRMTAEVNSGHPGGSPSCTDALATLYFRVLRHDPKNPAWPDRRVLARKGT